MPSEFSEKLAGKVWCSLKTNNTFEKAKFLTENQDWLYGLDGVIFNESALKSQYGLTQSEEVIRHWSKHQINDESIKGEFAGFALHKQDGLFIKANPNGTKPWFYVQAPFGTIISNSLKSITQLLKRFNEPLYPNEKAAMELLTYGYLIGNKTTFEGILKLRAGEQLLYKEEILTIKPCSRLNEISYQEKPIKEQASVLNELLTENIVDSYRFNKSHGYDNIATLSGGLDARANITIAIAQGHTVDHTLCMGQTGSADMVIAANISKELGLKHTAYSLDSAKFLKNIKENISLNEGLVVYSGASHLYAMLQDHKTPIGLIQSGQIGNIIGGYCISGTEENKPNLSGKAYTTNNLSIVNEWVNEEIKEWKNEEVAKLSERFFNGTNNGSWIAEKNGYYTSPFLQSNVASFILGVHPKQKVNYQLYFHWIKHHMPSMMNWPWEATGVKPTGTWTIEYGKWRNRVLKGYWQYLRGKHNKLSMNPYDFWWKEHAWIPTFVQAYWDKYHDILKPYHLTYKMAEEMFRTGTLLEKTQVLTVLVGLNYHLNE